MTLKYKWIKVNQPTAGLDQSQPETDIDSRAASDCQNVYFHNGEIRKRFGYGEKENASIRDLWYIAGTSTQLYPSPADEVLVLLQAARLGQAGNTATGDYVVAITANNVYFYDNVNNVWCCNDATWVETCEAAADFAVVAGGVVADDPAVFVQGSNSMKVTMPNLVGAAKAVWENTAATFDFTMITHVRFWFRSDIALAAGAIRFFYTDETGAPGGDHYTNLPAIPANTWTYCNLDLGFPNYPAATSGSSYDACTTYGFSAAAGLGIFNFWVDALIAWRGFYLTTANSALYPTNWTQTLDSGSIYLYHCNYALPYFVRQTRVADSASILVGADGYQSGDNTFHLCKALHNEGYHLHLLAGQTITAADHATIVENLHRDRWADLINADTWTGGTSGHTDLVERTGTIVNAVKYNSETYIFKVDSVVHCSHVGGETAIFSWNTVFSGDGLRVGRLFSVFAHNLMWVGKTAIWICQGGFSPQIFGQQIKDDLYDALAYEDGAYVARSFTMNLAPVHLTAMFVPAESAYPDTAWLYDYVYNAWTKWNFTPANITAGCSYSQLIGTDKSDGVWLGNSSGELFRFDLDSKNDRNVAITAWWNSKKFTHPQNGDEEITRWKGLGFRARGDSITIYVRTDNDSDWVLKGTQTLTSDMKWYFLGFDTAGRWCKVRFYNNTKSSTFAVDKFALKYEEETVH